LARMSSALVRSAKSINPAHEVVAAKARVGADNDLHVGPLAPDTLDQAGEFHNAASRAVLIGRTKLGTKQVLATKNVKRHVTILFVVALKEPAKLIAMDRIVSQLVMVVEIFVTQRQSVNPLGNQVVDGMFDQFGVTVIGEASGESCDD